MRKRACVPPDQRKIERAIVLELLSDEHGESCSCAELAAGLGDVGASALDAALGRLREHGVVLAESDDVFVSRCARRLDALGLIGI